MNPLPTRQLREHPELDQLKRQAKELLEAYRQGEAAAAAEVNTHYRGADPADFTLHHAQLVLARSYGFPSWAKLKAYVDGATVKHLAEAVKSGDTTSVRAMLTARPELINMEQSYGNEFRPLHFAVMNRDAPMVRLLMQHGADPGIGIYPHRDATGALTIARERDYSEIAAVIEEEQGKHEVPSPDSEEEAQPEARHEPAVDTAAARDAVARGDAAWLRARRAEGNLANHVEWRSGGLLTAAVHHNRPDMLDLLLDFGFDPDERVSAGEGPDVHYSQAYPLWHAAAAGKLEMIESLLAHGADPNAHVDSSGSPVYSAYSHRQAAALDLLERHGGLFTADIAGIYRETEKARRLLAADQSTAAELVEFGAKGGDPEIVRMALPHLDWSRDDPRWFWILEGTMWFWNHLPKVRGKRELPRATYVQCFRMLLERCDANLRGRHNRTLLHEVAAMDPHVAPDEAVEFAGALLDAGADTRARDEIFQSTPLGWACRWGRLEIAQYLIARGADPVEATAARWATPRAWAEKRGHAEIATALGRGPGMGRAE